MIPPRVFPVLFAGLLAAGQLCGEEAVELIDGGKPNGGWEFGNGPEFPGATGSLTTEADPSGKDTPLLLLQGDFTKGGNYVQAGRHLPAVVFEKLSFRLKAPGAGQLSMRLIDGSSQCHQIRLKLDKSDGWQLVEFPVAEFFQNMGTSAALPNVANYEKWGGKNDGKWHPPAKAIYFLVGKGGAGTTFKMWLGDVRLYASGGAAFREDFEKGDALPKGWETQGAAALAGEGAFKGAKCLKLSRTLDNLQQETSATGPAFPAAPGVWNVSGALKTELNSPDSSYNGTLVLQALKAGGAVLESTPLYEPFGKTGWKEFRKRVELPNGTTSARFVAKLNKADGAFWVDELSAARSTETAEKRIERIVLTTDRIGNLLLPDDKPVAHVKVEALRALRENELNLVWSVQDYWGAEQAAPATVKLEAKGQDKNRFVYTADLDLSAANMELVRYYELHVELPRTDPLCISPFLRGRELGDSDREFTGIARLPVAASKQYKPEEIPFTIRNWDSRIREYFFLADRIGIRMAGVWGGWDSKPPYKPHLPGLDVCKQLDMKWVTGTPASDVERNGFKHYDEKSLREGMQNFLKEFAGQGLGMIAMGNEPHGKLEKVKENVKAYKIVYEAVKKFDPNIFVIGTSVEPNEDYFNEGYQNALDAYDFHVYESYQNVREAMRHYRKLMEKHKAVKPIYSTELGLNSQGMTRYAVAVDLVKKVVSFFAEGGVNVSWFTIMYPDPQGKARGTSGDAHCVFDCKYSQYNPRIDAISYYDMLNSLCVKKFSAEKVYPDGTQAYLFRDKDDKCLLVLWNETGRRDVTVPLTGVTSTELIRIDGSRATLTLDGSLTAGVSPEPLLLLYTQKDARLPEALTAPAFALASAIQPVIKGGESALMFKGEGLTAEALRVLVPPFWKATLRQAEAGVVECKIAAPEVTSAREGRVVVQKLAKDAPCGEILLPLPIAGPLQVEVLPVAATEKLAGGIELHIRNNSRAEASVNWRAAIVEEFPMQRGSFNLTAGQAPRARIDGADEGAAIVPAGSEKVVAVPLANIDPLALYRIKARISDSTGRSIEQVRLVAGFVGVPKLKQPLNLDGVIDEADWAAAKPAAIKDERQFFTFGQKAGDKPQWDGPQDLSAGVRFLWDDACLYLGVAVQDDVFSGTKSDGNLWNQDGLQFLVDPTRTLTEKAGKYDYSAGLGTKGPQAWCHLSADKSNVTGEMKDIRVAAKRGEGGAIVYEVAIPWKCLAPFAPGPGRNLGLSLILNEDDGPGRNGFMGWFSGVHDKQLDLVGDLILQP